MFACLLFSIFQGVWTLLQSVVIEDESSFQVQPTAYRLPPEPFVLSCCPPSCPYCAESDGIPAGKRKLFFLQVFIKSLFFFCLACVAGLNFSLLNFSSIEYIINMAFLITKINRSLDILSTAFLH